MIAVPIILSVLAYLAVGFVTSPLFMYLFAYVFQELDGPEWKAFVTGDPGPGVRFQCGRADCGCRLFSGSRHHETYTYAMRTGVIVWPFYIIGFGIAMAFWGVIWGMAFWGVIWGAGRIEPAMKRVVTALSDTQMTLVRPTKEES